WHQSFISLFSYYHQETPSKGTMKRWLDAKLPRQGRANIHFFFIEAPCSPPQADYGECARWSIFSRLHRKDR
ncbi:MAG: hypothetical protein PVH08_14085, partial [Syntrophobacterales bacterium]